MPLVDDWRPIADTQVMRTRARTYAAIRRFFAERDVMEVETPILSSAATPDPALESLGTACIGRAGVPEPLWLHTSPEFAMKRLLAAGMGPIYQICKVFRGAERGRLHNSEFSMLEWYRPGWGVRRLMGEVANLVCHVLERPSLAMEIIGYRELFESRLGIDPFRVCPEELSQCAQDQAIPGAKHLDLEVDGWLDLLLTHCIEAGLGRGRLTFVCDYPPSQAALARVRGGDDPVAERFELYLEGVELANGFQELTDPQEQRRRFEAEHEARRNQGLSLPPIDEHFLAALASGMPDASGVALGLDRLLMLMTGSRHIDQVLAFPVERA